MRDRDEQKAIKFLHCASHPPLCPTPEKKLCCLGPGYNASCLLADVSASELKLESYPCANDLSYFSDKTVSRTFSTFMHSAYFNICCFY